jgi:hypothetical protein
MIVVDTTRQDKGRNLIFKLKKHTKDYYYIDYPLLDSWKGISGSSPFMSGDQLIDEIANGRLISNHHKIIPYLFERMTWK